MTVIESVIQGAIQGLAEFLPISSSGHIMLFQHFFGMSDSYSLFFTAMLHVGTLLSVFVAFRKEIFLMIKAFFGMIGDIFKGRFKYSECDEYRRSVIMILVTLIPLLVFYFVKDYYEFLSVDDDIVFEGCCFVITGVMLLLACSCIPGKRTGKDMKIKDSLIIGAVQGISTLPGISRSGSTISTGMLLGLDRNFMIAFSFIMSIPAVIGSAGSELLDAVESGAEINWPMIAIGIATAFVVGLLSIILLKWIMKSNRFKIFGYYTVFLGCLVIVCGIVEHLCGLTVPQLLSDLLNRGVV